MASPVFGLKIRTMKIMFGNYQIVRQQVTTEGWCQYPVIKVAKETCRQGCLKKTNTHKNYIGLNTEGQQLTSSKGNLAGIFKLGWLVSDDGCLLEQRTLSNIGDGAITGISIRKWNAPLCNLKISGWGWNKLAIRLFLFSTTPLKCRASKFQLSYPLSACVVTCNGWDNSWKRLTMAMSTLYSIVAINRFSK